MAAHDSLVQHFEVGGALAGDAIGASNGVSFDTRGIEEVMIILMVGDIATSGTLECKVQHSATGAVWADITGASFVQSATEAANLTFVGRIVTNRDSSVATGIRRHLRIVGTVATEALSYGACIVAGALHDKPVTQESTVAFNLDETAD